jgi:hypothetical protein
MSRIKLYEEFENMVTSLETDLTKKHKVEITEDKTTVSGNNAFTFLANKIKTLFNKNVIDPSENKKESADSFQHGL